MSVVSSHASFAAARERETRRWTICETAHAPGPRDRLRRALPTVEVPVRSHFTVDRGTNIKDLLGARLAASEAQMKYPTRLSEMLDKASDTPTAGLRWR
jgi:hypothetical protein